MPHAVATIWDIIERELAKHAPTVLPTLNGPATDADIRKLESAIGYTLPDDVSASLKRHNGQNDPTRLQLLCEAGILLSVEGMLEAWGMLTDLERDFAGDFPNREFEWWNSAYLPVADYEGDYLCVNLLPDSCGEVLQHVHDGNIEHNIFPSFTDWLQSVATVLSENRFAIDDGYLDFWYDVDTENTQQCGHIERQITPFPYSTFTPTFS